MKKKTKMVLWLVAGVLVLLPAVNLIRLFTGRPIIRENYVSKLNEMVRPAEVEEEENALIFYQQSFDLFEEPSVALDEIIRRARSPLPEDYGRISDLAAGEQEEMRKWLKGNEPAWEKFEAGSRRRHYRAEYDESLPMMEILLPYVSSFRKLGRMGIWQARLIQEGGDVQEVFNVYLALLRAGLHLQGRPMLMEHLTGRSISRECYTEIMHFLARAKLTGADLEWFQKELTGLYKGDYPRANIEGERLFFLDIVQRVFTEGGPGGGHLVRFNADLNLLILEGADDFTFLDTMFHAGRDKTTAQVQELYDQLDKRSDLRPYEVHQKKMRTTEQKLKELPRRRYKLIHVLFPALERVFLWDYQNKAHYEAVNTVLALQRWRLAEGQYPEKLEELEAGGYLPRLPMDPYGPGILSYQRRGDDFILYSWGADFDDDGGLQNSDDL
ncbi:MAG: hypothetical protein AMJ79_11970, partial [Phycisphaerae bacterium SM23_30]